MYTTQKEYLNNFAAGIAMACTLMYIRVLLEAFVINQEVALTLFLPYAAASVSGLIFAYILYKYSKTATFNLEETDIAKNPLQLSEAITGFSYRYCDRFGHKFTGKAGDCLLDGRKSDRVEAYVFLYYYFGNDGSRTVG